MYNTCIAHKISLTSSFSNPHKRRCASHATHKYRLHNKMMKSRDWNKIRAGESKLLIIDCYFFENFLKAQVKRVLSEWLEMLGTKTYISKLVTKIQDLHWNIHFEFFKSPRLENLTTSNDCPTLLRNRSIHEIPRWVPSKQLCNGRFIYNSNGMHWRNNMIKRHLIRLILTGQHTK